MDELDLTEADIHSSLWLKLVKHWNDRIDDLRKMNETDKTEIETAKLRGRIAEVRLMIVRSEER